jgi:two-component sensor histidine kinase
VLLLALVGLRLRTRQLRRASARLSRLVEERTRELQQSRDDLEKRVAERTTELEQDIAERKKTEQALVEREEQIRASLREKEALLKEIHHRVKNNLQIIISLLNLQAAHTKDPAILGAFAESENRVRSMALVHESLYRSSDLARVVLAPHVQRLCEHLYRCYGVDTRRIELRTTISDAALDLDRAIPCGLIINELVSNALKYAFPDGGKGSIHVKLDHSLDRYTLLVKDNGIGLPEGFDFRRADSLGLQLVCGLTEQIGGTIEYLRDGGSTFRIEFGA